MVFTLVLCRIECCLVVSPKLVHHLNWNQYFQNTKQVMILPSLNQYAASLKDIESGLRYAITRWEGEHHHDILIEFKRMRLSHNPDEDKRMLEIQLILENIIDQICSTQPEVKGKSSF